jgi:hypothetical protein
MSATRILWGQMLLALLVAFLFIWAATQWTAWCLGFQAQLGPPIGQVFGVPVYHPLIFFYWWYAYDAYAPHIFMQGAAIAASGGLAAIAVAITMSVLRAREAIINTNRRTYHLELKSSTSIWMASLSWNYPQDGLIAIEAQAQAALERAPVASGIDATALRSTMRSRATSPTGGPCARSMMGHILSSLSRPALPRARCHRCS